jgi:hypothetical protein
MPKHNITYKKIITREHLLLKQEIVFFNSIQVGYLVIVEVSTIYILLFQFFILQCKKYTKYFCNN